MRSIIITAANSFIGYRLCREFSKKGYYVYAVVRENFTDIQKFRELQNIRFIYCDMQNYHLLAERVNCECEIGIALAWDGTRGESRSDRKKQKDNIVYSMRSLHSFIELGCNTVISAGSQAEYGPQESQKKVSETNVCRPNTEYGKCKLEFYEVADSYCKANGVRFIEPRYFSLYGPGDSENTMLMYLVRNMLHNLPCKLTECSQMWDYLHVDDAVRALIMLIDNKWCKGVYNFGSGDAKELRLFVEEVKKVLESTSELEFGAVPYPETGAVHVHPSIDKLKAEIIWEPEISFENGILEMAELQRKLKQR